MSGAAARTDSFCIREHAAHAAGKNAKGSVVGASLCSFHDFYSAAEKPTDSKIAVASGVRQKSRKACAVSTFCETFRTAAG